MNEHPQITPMSADLKKRCTCEQPCSHTYRMNAFMQGCANMAVCAYIRKNLICVICGLGIKKSTMIYDLIVVGAAAMIEAELRVQDIREIIFPHPTVSEIIKDAMWTL
jgi:hypothetical protein